MPHKNSSFSQTIAWYNDHAEDYAKNVKNSVNMQLLERFMARLQPGALTLDAGSGSGRDTRIFKDHGFEPVGVDITPGLVKFAQHENPDIEFLEGDLRQLAFPDQYFAGIWANASLVHLEKISDVRQVLKEFWRVLKPGGLVHIKVKQQLGQDKTGAASHGKSGEFKRFFRFYTKEELAQYLQEVGFKVIDLQDNQTGSRSGRKIRWVVALGEKRVPA